MKVAKEDSLQGKVREVMEKGGEMKVTEIVKAGPEMPNAYQRVTNALRDLAAAGQVRKAGAGLYAWIDKIPDLKGKQSQLRMARFMVIRTKKNEPFAAADVAHVAECCIDWAKKYITRLKNDKFLVMEGKVNKQRPVYLATEKAMLVKPEEWPGIKRNAKVRANDELMEKIRNQAAALFAASREANAQLDKIARQAWEIVGLLGPKKNLS